MFDGYHKRFQTSYLGGSGLAADWLNLIAPAPKITPLVTDLPPTPTLNPEQALTKAARQATPTPIPTPTPWQVVTPTSTLRSNPAQSETINPLTGLQVENSALLWERPIMVKLANWPQSLRPFNQIIDADMVFEYFIGYQTNHLLALYYGGDATAVGPLAPGRVVDARLARRYQASLVVASAPPTVEGVFEQTLPDRVFYRGYAPCPGICTETEAQGGNSVVNTSAIRNFIKSEGIEDEISRLPDLYFDQKIDAWDESALRVSYLYADFSWMDGDMTKFMAAMSSGRIFSRQTAAIRFNRLSTATASSRSSLRTF